MGHSIDPATNALDQTEKEDKFLMSLVSELIMIHVKLLGD
jgi:hypothetical protein